MLPGYSTIVYVVSPDAAVRRSLILLLEAEGIETRSFASAASLLEELPALGTKQAARRCVLLEERLPGGGGGLDLAERLIQADLDLSTIILQAAVGPVRDRQLRKVPATVVFADPFHMDALLQKVRCALGLPKPHD